MKILVLACSLALAVLSACGDLDLHPGREAAIADAKERCEENGGEFRVDPANSAPMCAYPGDPTE